MVSDPGNKGGAGVKMPGPGQLVWNKGLQNQDVLSNQDPLLLPTAPPLLLSPWLSQKSCPPDQAHLPRLGPVHC